MTRRSIFRALFAAPVVVALGLRRGSPASQVAIRCEAYLNGEWVDITPTGVQRLKEPITFTGYWVRA